MNLTIKLRPESFTDCAGIFPMVHTGKLTEIVDRFTQRDQNDVLQQLVQQDELGRTPLDVASYFDFKNIALFLAVKSGTPSEYML